MPNRRMPAENIFLNTEKSLLPEGFLLSRFYFYTLPSLQPLRFRYTILIPAEPSDAVCRPASFLLFGNVFFIHNFFLVKPKQKKSPVGAKENKAGN